MQHGDWYHSKYNPLNWPLPYYGVGLFCLFVFVLHEVVR